MAKEKFAIGIDYGTESGRVVVIRVRDGDEAASAIVPYADGVIDTKLPGGPKLEPDWALQNPRDYLRVVEQGVPKALKAARVKAGDVIGLGTDFTASTPMPTRRDGTPLSFLPQYRKHPHAWVKLWKHHAAQPEANRINQIGRERDEDFIRIYGGKYSSEWFFSKLLQILDEAPEIYAATERFIEAADWIVWQLTGEEKRNTCTAGYKAMWVKGRGFPSRDFFRALHPAMENVGEEERPRRGNAGFDRQRRRPRRGPGMYGDRAGVDGDDHGHLYLPLAARDRAADGGRDVRHGRGRRGARPLGIRGGAVGGRRHLRVVLRACGARRHTPRGSRAEIALRGGAREARGGARSGRIGSRGARLVERQPLDPRRRGFERPAARHDARDRVPRDLSRPHRSDGFRYAPDYRGVRVQGNRRPDALRLRRAS